MWNQTQSESTVEATEELCLAKIATLTEALSTAMLAIASNSAEQFEQCVWHQEILCADLRSLLLSLRSGSLEPETAKRLTASFGALHSANGTYARLLDQTRSWGALLHQLCADYCEASQPLTQSKAALAVSGSWEV